MQCQMDYQNLKINEQIVDVLFVSGNEQKSFEDGTKDIKATLIEKKNYNNIILFEILFSTFYYKNRWGGKIR